MKIKQVKARQVYDCRCTPTVEVDVTLDSGAFGRAIVASGASTGKFEALELRDGDPSRFRGKTVYQAIKNIEQEIAPAVIGFDASRQADLDQLLIELDGTPNKTRLGANALLGVSMAAAYAAAQEAGVPLYRHLGGAEARTLPASWVQLFNGGVHTERSIDIQDFSIIPMNARNHDEYLEIGYEIFQTTKDMLRELGKPVGSGDEGGFWPIFDYNEEALELIMQAIRRAGFKPREEIMITMDVAASSFFADGKYHLELEDKHLSAQEWAQMLESWVDKYPIISIEDGMAEEDWQGWELLTARIGDRCQLVGDDLFTTNVERIQEGIRRGAANASLIKLNQIGTVTETLAAVKVSQNANYLPVVSARSGDTEDNTCVHIAVATNSGQLKPGGLTRTCRINKYNEVVRIGQELGDKAIWPIPDLFARFLK